jgi:hypothetical protein
MRGSFTGEVRPNEKPPAGRGNLPGAVSGYRAGLIPTPYRNSPAGGSENPAAPLIGAKASGGGV